MKAGVFFGQNAVDGNAAEYGGWWGVLQGCVPDARDLAIAFANMGFDTKTKFSGFEVAGPSIPRVLTLDCTREAWHQTHLDLQAVAQPGDIFVIGNSGHGGTYQTANGVGQTMCFADGQIDDAHFHSLMLPWRPGVKVIYILDTCYSGGNDRDRMKFAPRVAPKWVSDRNAPRVSRPPMDKADIQAQVVLLCAAQDDETASDGQYNGAFTGTLLAVWEQARKARRILTWRQWIDSAASVMSAAFPDQHPEMHLLGAGSTLADEIATG